MTRNTLMDHRSLLWLFAITLLPASQSALSGEVETSFLKPGKLLFTAHFDDGITAPSKPGWMLRKTDAILDARALRIVNAGGNGPFIRLHPEDKGGPLPQDYILTFSFRIEENPEVKRSNKYHDTRSAGHRFSFGHYAAKFGWSSDKGLGVSIGHGKVFGHPEAFIEKGRWYHVTAELRGDEILVTYADGPSWFLKHEHIRTRPQGWEFFTHASEVGILDNVRVWSVETGEQPEWPETKARLLKEKRAFLSTENPDFSTQKQSS